jgi:hypothetical protein
MLSSYRETFIESFKSVELAIDSIEETEEDDTNAEAEVVAEAESVIQPIVDYLDILKEQKYISLKQIAKYI